jgi:hypothetical protein
MSNKTMELMINETLGADIDDYIKNASNYSWSALAIEIFTPEQLGKYNKYNELILQNLGSKISLAYFEMKSKIKRSHGEEKIHRINYHAEAATAEKNANILLAKAFHECFC